MSNLKQLQLKLKYFFGSLFFLRYVIMSFRYSRWRDKVERIFSQPSTEKGFDKPGKLIQQEATSTGAIFYFELAELEVSFLTDDFVRIDWKPGIPPIPYGISRHQWEEVETKLEQNDTSYSVSSSKLKVVVAEDGSITFYDATGQVLREEKPPIRKIEGWVHTAKLRQEEHIYGLGEKASTLNLRAASINNRPKIYRIWNYDAAGKYAPGSDPMYISIPVYLGLHSNGSYLIFYENTFDATFTFSETATANFEGGALRYYFTYGAPAQLVDRYTELTGRPELPPRWSLGYHQSKWGYDNEQKVREEAKKFQSYNLPISAIHLDIDCQVGYRAFTIDPERFPNLPAFTQELQKLGVQFITIMNPGIKLSPHNNLFVEGRVLEGFCKLPNGRIVVAPVWPGWSVFPDFTNPKVRRWWSRQYQYLLDVGVAGFWHDMNEPAAFILWGDRSLPRVTQHFMEGRGADHREAHNIYGLLQAQAGFESLREYRPNQRPFIVSRAGWAGLQRYAWTWTGDVDCSWEALRQTISIVIGLGLSGVAYSGSDIGGFQGNPSPELYVRWFQTATFHTFYRTHSANNVEHRTPWTYGEPYLSIIRSYLQLRYKLLPYFYTLAWEATQKGYPPVRPVFWASYNETALWDVEDAFLLGDALLVCPIVTEGALQRQITLPHTGWYSFWDDKFFEGGQEVTLKAPLETIPLLVKAGTILPMEENKTLTLHIYPPVEESSQGYIYSDAGDGYGEWRLDKFHINRNQEGLELTWEHEGEYAFPYTEIRLHVHGVDVKKAIVDDVEISATKEIQCNTFKKVHFVM